eukprot:CAMPEP_0113652398 /NCGR_PEP_ID=MMETSP0017_2-20120614/27987_1 /TAXON_ID=2856 /ORGANISM="Cylindrotheca closterium" /LENGTH=227 /DNA_ID=CAMNT_0000565247 /DNA_START=1 /DNA_END=684 /DNA_ORIENTATION=+ /assembly_acc=CAM_ASM_000147
MKKLRLASIMNGLLLSTLIPVIALLGFYVQPIPQPVLAALLLPYLGWLAFATFLNVEICKRNPTDNKISLPSWTPPDTIFGPVWSTLYTLMGLAIGRLWNVTASNPQQMNTLTLTLWMVHYVINILWAPVFFGMKKLRLASIMNGLLLSTLIPVIVLLGFYVQPIPQPVLAALLLPYLGWLTFATFLNVEICKRNPTDNKFGGYNEARFQADLARLQQQAARFADGE